MPCTCWVGARTDKPKCKTPPLNLRSPEGGWTRRADLPNTRGSLSAGVVGNVTYMFGREENPAPNINGLYSETEAYDTVTDMWTKLTPMTIPRHETSAASVGGEVYIPDGSIVKGALPVDALTVFKPCRGKLNDVEVDIY